MIFPENLFKIIAIFIKKKIKSYINIYTSCVNVVKSCYIRVRELYGEENYYFSFSVNWYHSVRLVHI